MVGFVLRTVKYDNSRVQNVIDKVEIIINSQASGKGLEAGYGLEREIMGLNLEGAREVLLKTVKDLKDKARDQQALVQEKLSPTIIPGSNAPTAANGSCELSKLKIPGLYITFGGTFTGPLLEGKPHGRGKFKGKQTNTSNEIEGTFEFCKGLLHGTAEFDIMEPAGRLSNYKRIKRYTVQFKDDKNDGFFLEQAFENESSTVSRSEVRFYEDGEQDRDRSFNYVAK